jgi:uncharacterized SAM-binding protein YcdF (DUF218 family)
LLVLVLIGGVLLEKKGFLYWMYDFLNVGSAPQKSDCIFVFAGRKERKIYGIELWKSGYAPDLVLSIGRFEWRGFYTLGFPEDGDLRKLVEATPPPQRHFIYYHGAGKAECWAIRPGEFGTRTEALEFSRLILQKGYHSAIVVSTSVHLRRIACVLENALPRDEVVVHYVAVPEAMSSVTRELWWRNAEGRSFVLEEYFKFLFYRVFLC